MTTQELRSHILKRAVEHADRMDALDRGEWEPELPAIKEVSPEPRHGAPRRLSGSVVNDTRPDSRPPDEPQDATATVYTPLSSLDLDIRTIRRRIHRFLDDDDYTLTKGRNGRIIFNIRTDMVGFITRRLR